MSFPYEYPPADVVNTHRNCSRSSLVSPVDRISLESNASAGFPFPMRADSRLSSISGGSTVDLVGGGQATDERTHRPSKLSSQWKLPLHAQATSGAKASSWTKIQNAFGRHCRGWKVIILGSWLNILLFLIPVSWLLEIFMPVSHTLIFIFCILSMVPLVKLHDLVTDELSARIGGSKTGLLNASMSNSVEVVIAITALRKCEIGVVQSSLIGSILSKLLLVLGMCFFAGGLRFSEQDFDSKATQVHSSLLSISVGAVLLPAAYHFALAGGVDGIQTLEDQKKAILRMSHGVSVVLLIIYIAYLLFQLWSHTHLYQENEKTSKPHAVRLPINSTLARRKPPRPKVITDTTDPADPIQTIRPPFMRSPSRVDSLYSVSSYRSSQSTLASEMTSIPIPTPPLNTTFELRKESVERGVDESASPSKVEKPEPQLSWTMTLLLLSSVTVMVAINAEWLVESMDGISPIVSKEWIGLILLPMVGSIAELVTTVNTSVQDRVTLSVSVAVGSTIQTALFVIPFMVILAWILNKPMALLFDPFESVVLYISVNTVGYVVADGKSNWLEGIILMCLYVIIAVSFWFYPGSTLATTLAVCTDT